MEGVKRGINATAFLKNLKEEKGWTLKEMALALGISERSVVRYLGGRNCEDYVVEFLIKEYGFNPNTIETVLEALNRVEDNQEAMMVMMKKMGVILARLDRPKKKGDNTETLSDNE